MFDNKVIEGDQIILTVKIWVPQSRNKYKSAFE